MAAPFRAAATLTHDVEPTRYAYTADWTACLNRMTTLGHSPAIGLVADASARHLAEPAIRRLRDYEIVCHGLHHRGDIARGRRQTIRVMETARARLERTWRAGCVAIAVPGWTVHPT